MWDEWDDDPDDYYNYRHQRRLSDPSANLNIYSRYGWKSKSGGGGGGGSVRVIGPGDISVGARARSENEGLDTLGSEVSEIEAGDLKDGKFDSIQYIFIYVVFPGHQRFSCELKCFISFFFLWLYFSKVVL